jgi:hypothetical protein
LHAKLFYVHFSEDYIKYVINISVEYSIGTANKQNMKAAYCLDNQLTYGGQVVGLTRRPRST